VSVLPKRLTRSVSPAAAVAALVMAGIAADASHFAAAQSRLEAEYTATLSGIPIGRGNWTIDITEDQYTAAASGGTSGLLRIFAAAHGTSSSHGTFAGGQPVPTSYAATIDFDRKIDDVRMVMVGGDVKDYSADPPVPPVPGRIPLTDADRRGVLDPLTSTLNRVGGNGDPVSPEACGRKVPVFDGRVRYDLSSEFKRIEQVKADKGYSGPVAVCAVYFVPISGYVPDRAVIKYLVAVRDAEVWLAPISGTRVLVPFRFSIPTPLGPGVLQATQFVSVAQPSHLGANTKTQ
jgi:uncharacterized protein DUF3108